MIVKKPSDIAGVNGKSAYELWLDVGNNGTLQDFLNSLTGRSAISYLVELSRWGITQGIPAKPWVNAHYITADNNIQGINNAIQWAYSNGYRHIVMPTGSYAICYPREIVIDKDYMTLDLNGSTFQVLYSSDSKSPFDTVSGSSNFWAWPSPAQSFVFVSAHNSHIINGKIFGERLHRSFTNPSERAIEWTTGVQFTMGSSHCSVNHCEIAHFMGDSIGFKPTAPAEYAEFGLILTVNDLDKNTGAVMAATGNTLVTQMISIPTGIFNVFSITGQGFTRPTGLITKDVGVYYYRADNTFITSIQNQKIYTPMTIPSGAAKYRFLFYEEIDATRTISSQLAIHLKFGLNPHHNLVEWNEIYGNHRGGIQPGGSENIIQYNTIHDIGTPLANGLDIYGKPLFNDPTRYAINQEDFFGDAITIRNNLIYGCFCGILCGIYNATIENNRIYNAGNVGINLYTMLRGVVTNNFIWKSTAAIGLMGAHFSNAHVEISSNTIVGGNAGNWVGDGGYHVVAEKNTLIDVGNFFMSLNDNDMHVFRNNHFKYNSYYSGFPTISVNRMEGCTLDVRGTNQKIVTINSYTLINCSFSLANLRIYGRDPSKREKVTINDCKFSNCILESNVATKAVKLLVSKCKLTDTTLRVANLNTSENPSINVTDSDIFIKTINFLGDPQINTSNGYGIIELERSNIEISNTTGFQYLIKNNYTVVPSTLSFSIKRSNLSYTGSPNLAFVYYSHKGTMKEFISASNKFLNMTLPAEDAGYFIGYDPLIENKAEPSSGYFRVGQTINNVAPTSGGYVGWVCLTTGTASSTGWIAATAYTVGQIVKSNGKVYSCTVAGTSGSTPPSHTSGMSSDGGVTWLFIDTLAVFKQYGAILI
ncbi:hypothetical protein BC351_00365 [Paenibacillus ferrarius]|uniref:Chitin-binding type-3 domain-containing protein n=1 Tax=Paenibacillus ferrarius TaxID=1469647 RepID=A0A1V4HS05_9BACL|nr:right-handed parallel beta-helix repeat-containing protein [Paenibacillus ferrarius]OPH61729.1 hypothetical protein BC351_00365 [Paenibacillus ferrarius]